MQFLDYVVKALVDNPNDVKINRTVDEMGVLLTLSVKINEPEGAAPRERATKTVDEAMEDLKI